MSYIQELSWQISATTQQANIRAPRPATSGRPHRHRWLRSVRPMVSELRWHPKPPSSLVCRTPVLPVVPRYVLLSGIPRVSVCTGAHLYSAPQRVASAETLLGPASGCLRPNGCRAMQGLGCERRVTLLPHTPLNKVEMVHLWDAPRAPIGVGCRPRADGAKHVRPRRRKRLSEGGGQQY
jgi:hypothetical protein